MKVLGLSYGFHDSAAAVAESGRLLAAVHEERLSLQKHDLLYPRAAIEYCLSSQDWMLEDVDKVVFYENPYLKFSRVFASSFESFPSTSAEFVESMKAWLGSKLWIHRHLAKNLNIAPSKIEFYDHHFSHACQAFIGSGLSESNVLVVDAIGEWSGTSMYAAHWEDGQPIFKLLGQQNFPHSLGLVYSAVTEMLGFVPNSDECSTMALSSFGQPIYFEALEKAFKLETNGSFKVPKRMLNFNKFFSSPVSKDFLKLLGDPDLNVTYEKFDCLELVGEISKLTVKEQHMANIAASMQFFLETSISRLANYMQSQTGMSSLCLAGGCALNCKSNMKLVDSKLFEKVFVPSDPGDGGAAAGVALHASLSAHPKINSIPDRFSPYQGPSHFYENDIGILEKLSLNEIESYLNTTANSSSYKFEINKYSNCESLVDSVSSIILDSNIVGWFQGAGEMGPRALGNRSILIRPDNIQLAKRLSHKVKMRASFRPYSLSLAGESFSKKFLNSNENYPYRLMQVAAKVNDKYSQQVRAGLHIDGTTRPQVCMEFENPVYYKLIEKFGEKFGIPAVVNTSFNERGLPIVSSPLNAIAMFLRTEMDVLVLGNFIVEKKYV